MPTEKDDPVDIHGGGSMRKAPRATAAAKRERGRPTKYEPRFCEEVEAFMAQGFSLTAFAGDIGVSRSTINEWMEHFPDFSEAVSRSKAKRLAFWERTAINVAAKGTGGPGAATVIVFGLKNMGGEEYGSEWKDKQEHEHSGGVGLTVNINGPDADL